MTRLDLRFPMLAMVAASLAAAQAGREGTVVAQEMKASASGGGFGSFIGPYHRSQGSTGRLQLEVAFALKKSTSPAMIYAISRPTGAPARMALVCLIKHRYAGDILDVSGQFGYRLHVKDGAGELKLSSRPGVSFALTYSTVVPPDKKAALDEKLIIGQTPIELGDGRIFLIDLSRETPVVNQIEWRLPIASADSGENVKKVQQVFDEVRASIAAGRTKKRLLALQFPAEEPEPDEAENRAPE